MLVNNYQQRIVMKDNNTRLCLHLLVQVPFTTPKLIASFLKKSLSATYKLLARLEREQMVVSREITELRMKVWSVTLPGHYSYLAIEKKDFSEFREPRLNRISPLTINHELATQQAHFKAIDAGFSYWQYGHSLEKDLRKRPDAIATNASQEVWAIELEFFPKSKKRVAVIMAAYLQEIAQGKYRKVAYIAPSVSLAWSLKKLFRSIPHVSIGGQRYALEQKHYDKFAFFSIDNWPHEPVE